MKRLGLALLFALYWMPGWALAQMTTPAAPTPGMREQAEQLLQLCKMTDEAGGFFPYQEMACYEEHLGAGVVAMQHQNWRGAIVEYTNAITLLVTYQQKLLIVNDRPGATNMDTTLGPYVLRATAYGATKQYQLAIADFTAAIAFKPDNAEAWNNRCWLRAITDDLGAALQDCEKALELAPNNAGILDSTGFVYLKLKNYPAAVANYKAALQTAPKTASSLYGLGLAEEAEGQQAQGAQDLAAAQQLDANITRDFGT